MNNILFTVISLSISGTLLALLIFLLKHALKNSVSKGFMYYIWALVLLRMIIPFGYEISTDIFDTSFPSQNTQDAVTDTLPVPSTPVGDVVVPSEPVINEDIVFDSEIQPEIPAVTQKASLWSRLKENLGYFWLAGAVVSIAWYAVSYAVFSRKISRTFVPVSDKEAEIFAELTDGKTVRLVRSNKIHTPMLMGIFRPTVILPEWGYKENELRVILKHELTHFSRGDIFYKWATVIVTSLHWFNPFAYLIRREINRACELSCDEAVIRNMTETERNGYGNMLISLASQKTVRAVSVTTTLCEGKKQLKGRLMGIKNYKKKNPVAVILMIAISLLLAGCGIVIPDFNASSDAPSQGDTSNPDGTNTVSGWKGTEEAKQAYGDVMLGNTRLYDTLTGEMKYLREYVMMNERNVEFKDFVFCDLNGDENTEVLVWYSTKDMNEDKREGIALYYDGQKICGYSVLSFHQDSLGSLKADGSYYVELLAIGGSGIQRTDKHCRILKMSINDSGLELISIAENNGIGGYTVSGNDATAEEYRRLYEEYKSKPDVVWNEFNQNNITKVFSVSEKENTATLTWHGTATARQAFRDVLQGKREFFVVETQKRISIDELSKGFVYFAGDEITVDTFTLCDLDGDGASETVLWLSVGGEMYSDFVILRYNGEEVYAYNIGYRAFSDLKADGTFSFADSAVDGGFGTISFFTDEEYHINDIAYSEYDREADDGTIRYYINGKSVTEEEFEEAFIEHDKKRSVFWCDFSDENIEKAFTISNDENAVRLIVDGHDSTAGQYVTVDADKQEVAVPITAILSELGCQVEWTDAKTVKVTYNGRKIVTFDLNDRDFGTPLPPGSNYCVRREVDNEIVVDKVTAQANFLNGLGYYIKVDYSSNTVSVIQKEDSN